MVKFEPPKIETITPPAMAEIIPAIGGASEAMARPSPSGRAISETTNPEKMFFGRPVKKVLIGLTLCMLFGINN